MALESLGLPQEGKVGLPEMLMEVEKGRRVERHVISATTPCWTPSCGRSLILSATEKTDLKKESILLPARGRRKLIHSMCKTK